MFENIPLIDTHCHLNMIVKEKHNTLINVDEILAVRPFLEEAALNNVSTIVNVGTNLTESINSVALAAYYPSIYASIGIHPTDCTAEWRNDLTQLEQILIKQKNNDPEQKKPIVAIGETGIDRYHSNYNLARQQDAFKAHIELALQYNLALIVHSRNAAEETLSILEKYKGQITRATMHCFSYSLSIAHDVINMGLMIGIDAPITYPRNEELRIIAATLSLHNIVLETDAPFLPPQIIRGQKNHPLHIQTIAEFIAKLRDTSLSEIAQHTTTNAKKLFDLHHNK